jgi:carotenoid 1,2-hydratase
VRIVSGLRDAGWHDLRESGAYEWWYVDAIGEDGRTAVVFIYFAGLPFSPDYLTDHERGRRPEALDHVAMFAAVYRDGKQHCYALNRYDRRAFAASRSALEVRVGPNTLHGEDGAVVATVDLPLLFGGTRLKGRLCFAPSTDPAALSIGKGAVASDHTWNPLAPACQVSGHLELHGATRGAEAFEGRGYVDHNYGSRPLTEGIRRWHWGRAHFDDVAAVFYHTEVEHGGGETVLALVEPGGARALDDAAFVAEAWRRRPLCPRFPTHLVVDAGTRLECRVRHILDWGPFYMRFLSDMRLARDGDVREAVGIAEYLDPRGLRARWLRPLVKTRIRRVAN